MSSIHHVTVAGYTTCKYFQKAVSAAVLTHSTYPDRFSYDVKEFNRDDYQEYRAKIADFFKIDHKTSPIVFHSKSSSPVSYIGGCDAFCAWLGKEYGMTDL